MFDTLEYARELEDAGFSREQAEVQAKALARAVEGRLATKSDILELRGEINEPKAATQSDIVAVKADLRETELRLQKEIVLVRGEIKDTEIRLTERIEASKHEVLKWLIGLLVAQSAMIVAIMAFLK